MDIIHFQILKLPLVQRNLNVHYHWIGNLCQMFETHARHEINKLRKYHLVGHQKSNQTFHNAKEIDVTDELAGNGRLRNATLFIIT